MRRSLLLAVTVSALAGTPAESQSYREFLKYCTAGSVRTCASTRIESMWDAAAGITRINLLIRNIQGWLLWDNSLGSALTRVAITAPQLTNPRNLTVTTSGNTLVAGSPAAYWRVRSFGLEGNTELLATTSSGTVPSPLEGGIFGCSALTMPSPSNYFRTCGDGGWVNFSFIASGFWDAATAEMGWAVIKTNADGASHICRSDDPLNCAVPPVTTTPEPATALLLGSGLAGLAALRRRRNRSEPAT